jgi:hypothetical protein
MTGCIFCQVAAHESPAKILFEDELSLAIQDINPEAPVHFLVIPRKHIPSLNEDLENDKALLGTATVAQSWPRSRDRRPGYGLSSTPTPRLTDRLSPAHSCPGRENSSLASRSLICNYWLDAGNGGTI